MSSPKLNVDFSIADALQKDKFIQSLSKKDAEKLEKSLEKKNVSKGEILIKEGEPQTKAFIVQSGGLERSHNGETVQLGSGALSGFLHLINSDPSFGTLKAHKDSVVWVIDSNNFAKLLSESESFNHSYISFLSKQLREHSNTLQSIRSKLGSSNEIKIAFFDSKAYMKDAFEKVNKEGGFNFKIEWFKERLNKSTASLASGFKVVCCFVNDNVDAETIERIAEGEVKLIALRCAGYDNVDLEAAKKHEISITRVPAYSPYAVAEFAVTLMLALNRRIHKAYDRVKEFNFSLNGLVGFDMHGKTVGLLGTGQIGGCAANILIGFGCKVLAYDIKEDPEMKKKGVEYVSKEELYAKCDIITVHLPLLKSTEHLVNADAFKQMKKGVILINTSRGAIVDSKALLDALEQGIVGAAGLDVYEGEKAYFFENKSGDTIKDQTLTRLVAAHNVIVTSHQAFLTHEALFNIATSTLESVKEFANGSTLKNLVVQQYKYDYKKKLLQKGHMEYYPL